MLKLRPNKQQDRQTKMLNLLVYVLVSCLFIIFISIISITPLSINNSGKYPIGLDYALNFIQNVAKTNNA